MTTGELSAWALAIAMASAATYGLLSAETTAAPHAPQKLSETGLYANGRADVIDEQNRPFSPQYPLWSDGATKSRWVFIPPGAVINARNVDAWSFPVGTRFWKEFAFNNRKVETRLLWRASPERWVFGTYVWDEDGRDATLAPPQGVPDVAEIATNRRHSLPSLTDCQACHGVEPAPLGFNALQLSPDRDPNAIHGEPLRPEMLTLKMLVDEHLLSSEAAALIANPPRIQTQDPQTRAMLGYVAANCGSCHNGRGEIAAMAPVARLGELLKDGDAVAPAVVADAAAGDGGQR